MLLSDYTPGNDNDNNILNTFNMDNIRLIEILADNIMNHDKRSR